MSWCQMPKWLQNENKSQSRFNKKNSLRSAFLLQTTLASNWKSWSFCFMYIRYRIWFFRIHQLHVYKIFRYKRIFKIYYKFWISFYIERFFPNKNWIKSIWTCSLHLFLKVTIYVLYLYRTYCICLFFESYEIFDNSVNM